MVTPPVTTANPETRWGPDGGWAVENEPLLTIGVRGSDEAYQFFSIAAAARQSDGDVVVVDSRARTVRLYGGDGVLKRTLGGPGSGPGQFQRPLQVLVGPMDSILNWDDDLFRVTTFDSAGALASVRSVARDAIARGVMPPLYPGSARMMPGGEMLVRLVYKNAALAKGSAAPPPKSPSQAPATEGRFRDPSGVVRVSNDLSHVETVQLFGGSEQLIVASPLGPITLTPPLAWSTSVAVQPNRARTCIGDQEGPEVVCFGPDGVRTAVQWSFAPAQITEMDAELAAWRAQASELYGQKLSADDVTRLLDAVPMPTSRPEYSELHVDHEGNLWVMRGPTAGRRSPTVDYMVFDSAGALLGVLPLPPIRVLEVGPDYLLGVHEDELEIEYLQVFRLVKR